MKLRYSVLRQDAEGTELKVLADDYANRGSALRAAKRKKAEEISKFGSWADRFYVALMEEV